TSAPRTGTSADTSQVPLFSGLAATCLDSNGLNCGFKSVTYSGLLTFILPVVPADGLLGSFELPFVCVESSTGKVLAFRTHL
uniref:Uncharacterized protein n=1 Tax=Poecilia mexicana TaxID=48701 RepID=A0A3B3YNL4_9TELE